MLKMAPHVLESTRSRGLIITTATAIIGVPGCRALWFRSLVTGSHAD